MTIDPATFDPPPQAKQFYADSLAELVASEIPFMLSGTYALGCLTGIVRPTKDLDVFCKAGDAPRILAHFKQLGHEVEFEDERWIGKVWKDGHFFDVIYNISSASLPVTEEWFRDSAHADVYGTRVRITPPTEFILSKLFIQDRYRYDGADVAHMILKQYEAIDWQRLLDAMELHWELLLIALLNFRFIYPTERHCIPLWLFEELLGRLQTRAELPVPKIRVCRGRLLSPRDYLVDITEWGFADVVGKGLEESHDRNK
ncbi:nucleotidyltransferase family protein [Sphingobium limneticum]|uniref:Nucleotidyltransferase family protein n=1 Tax=Sphingobium limneticum TaxID=1007511 RepID=A0A5J5I9S6_9SPHN|nr:nucleotidyltransferase family protein [Sphingobium limneticum]KAA9018887.1 nucleotidyltransferase family protein [Sphingobium limneticum]KAA9031461.1 nucleotidyltransferase family protein [Sphingobium limneticum]